MGISCLDRDPWVAVAFAVPLTIVLPGALAGHPFVFVPPLALAVLAGVAFVVMDFYKGAERKLSRAELEAEARARAEAGCGLEAEARAPLRRQQRGGGKYL
jgi:hypothetical protein